MAKKSPTADAPDAQIEPTAAEPPPVVEPTAPGDPPPADVQVEPRAPWRVVAVARKPVAVFFPNGGYTRLRGGDWVLEPDRVATVAHDTEHFELLPCDSPEHLAEMQAQHAALVARLHEMAAMLGYVAHPAGDPCDQ